MDSDDDEPGHASGPFCVVWVYRDTPDAFERAARYALQNTGYGLEVVVVLTEQGARLVQRDRLLQMMRLEHIVELMDQLVEHKVKLELDIGAARRAGVVQTLGALPGLRVADDQRVAELTTGARMTARY
jgi:predicted peroxiredoxin